MPWECKGCGAEVVDDAPACPQCAEAKTSWTLVTDKTRTFTVGRGRSLVVETSPEDSSLPDDGDARAALPRTPARTIRPLTKDRARTLARHGGRPPLSAVVFVELHPKAAGPQSVLIVVLHETEEAAELPFQVAATGDPAAATLCLVCVCGAGDLEGVAFPGTRILDLSDPAGACAPAFEVEALKRTPHEVEVDPPYADHWIALTLRRANGDPLAESHVLLHRPDGETDRKTTDSMGKVRWDGLPEGDYTVSVEGEEGVLDVVAEPTIAQPAVEPEPPSDLVFEEEDVEGAFDPAELAAALARARAQG